MERTILISDEGWDKDMANETGRLMRLNRKAAGDQVYAKLYTRLPTKIRKKSLDKYSGSREIGYYKRVLKNN